MDPVNAEFFAEFWAVNAALLAGSRKELFWFPAHLLMRLHLWIRQKFVRDQEIRENCRRLAVLQVKNKR